MRIVGLAVACLVVLAAGIYARSALVLGRHFAMRPSSVHAATDPARIAHGQHLVAMACAGCHRQDLGGGPFVDQQPFMRLSAANLTQSARTYSDAEFEAAIRQGVKRDGRSLLIMPSEVFGAFANNDVEDIIAGLRAAPAVDRSLPPPAIGPVGRALIAFGVAKLQSAQLAAALPVPPTTAPLVAASVEYGRYLSHVGGCVQCHGEGLSGGLIPNMGPNKRIASNLTPEGLGTYNESTFARAMREGIRPGGTPIDTFMPWREFRVMNDTEVGALYTYLRTVPPRKFGNR
jgi:mono/diheme cytochrome c family protein